MFYCLKAKVLSFSCIPVLLICLRVLLVSFNICLLTNIYFSDVLHINVIFSSIFGWFLSIDNVKQTIHRFVCRYTPIILRVAVLIIDGSVQEFTFKLVWRSAERVINRRCIFESWLLFLYIELRQLEDVHCILLKWNLLGAPEHVIIIVKKRRLLAQR